MKIVIRINAMPMSANSLADTDVHMSSNGISSFSIKDGRIWSILSYSSITSFSWTQEIAFSSE